MGKTTLIVRIDEDTKEEARQLASEVGLTLSNLVNIQLKQVIRSREIKIEAPKKGEIIDESLLDSAKATVSRARRQAAKPFQTVKEAMGSIRPEDEDDN